MQHLDKLDMSGLESQLNLLLQQLRQLKLENSQLRQRLMQTRHDHLLLEEKNKHAMQQINHLITQLKDQIR